MGIMASKKKNIKMSQKELKEMLDERLDDESKAKMQEMLKAGVPLKEVLDHFARQCDPPEEQLTEMEKKMQKMTQGQDLTNYQIYELMKEQMDAESQKKMEELLKQGHSKKDVMEMMMKVGKSQEEETRDTAETMKHIMASKKKNIKMSQKELKEMLDERLDDESKAKMQEMLKAG